MASAPNQEKENGLPHAAQRDQSMELRSALPHTGSPNPGRVRKESGKSTPGRAPKVPKECALESQKSGVRLFSDSFQTLLRLRGAVFGHFWGPALEYSFRTLFGLFQGSAPHRARETLCGGPIASMEQNKKFKSMRSAVPSTSSGSLVHVATPCRELLCISLSHAPDDDSPRSAYPSVKFDGDGLFDFNYVALRCPVDIMPAAFLTC